MRKTEELKHKRVIDGRITNSEQTDYPPHSNHWNTKVVKCDKTLIRSILSHTILILFQVDIPLANNNKEKSGKPL